MLSLQQQRSITDVESPDAAPEGTGVPDEARHPRIEVLDARVVFDTYHVVRLRGLCEERKRVWEAWGVALEKFNEAPSEEATAAVQKTERDFAEINGSIASVVAVAFGSDVQ